MIWMESSGGPLVVMAENDVGDWSGSEGDYDRACSVDFVGTLPGPAGTASLVIGDEPAGTTFVPDWGALVRWLHAETGTDVHAVLRPLLEGATWEPGPVFDVTGPLILFDSAVPGSDSVVRDARHPDAEPATYEREDVAIRCDVAPGRYVIQSADLEPDERTCFRVHRFAPVT